MATELTDREKTLVEVLVSLVQAANEVEENWEDGDLADATNSLLACASEAEAVLNDLGIDIPVVVEGEDE